MLYRTARDHALARQAVAQGDYSYGRRYARPSPSHNIKMAPVDSDRIIEAEKLVKTDPRKAESLYKDILSRTPSATNDAAVREFETALVKLGELYRDEKYVN
jgi:hypothetical protein